MAKVDFDAEQFLEFLMLLKEDVVIRRHCDEFRKTPFDSLKCGMYALHRNEEYLLEKRRPCFPIYDHEKNSFAGLAGCHEVGFSVSKTVPLVYVFRAFIDEGAASELCMFRISSPSPLFSFVTVVFYLSAMRAGYVTINTILGNICQMLFVTFDPS